MTPLFKAKCLSTDYFHSFLMIGVEYDVYKIQICPQDNDSRATSFFLILNPQNRKEGFKTAPASLFTYETKLEKAIT